MKKLRCIDQKLRKSAKNLSKMCKFIKYAMAVLPIIFSIIAFLCAYQINILEFWLIFANQPLLIVAGITCIAMVIISVLYFFVIKEEEIFIGELNENKNLLIENKKIKQSNEDLVKYTNELLQNQFSDLIELAQFIRYIDKLFPIIISGLLQNKNNPQDFYKNFSNVMNMLYENLNYIYNPYCHQMFTLALYLFDSNEKSEYKLKPYYSQKPNMINRGKGRWWKVGDGQIGLTYMNNSSYNYQNLEEQINPKTFNTKKDDEICYVSALSFPIHYADGSVRGVFCITSNVISAFYDNSNIFKNKISETKEVCSKTIASIIELCLNQVFPKNEDMFVNLPKSEQESIELENPEKNNIIYKQ